MRFIFYFIFFGLLFYAISVYFPEAFHTLVSWVAKLYDFIYNIINGAVEHVNNWVGNPGHHMPEAPKP